MLNSSKRPTAVDASNRPTALIALVACLFIIGGAGVSSADDHDAGVWLVNQIGLPLGDRLAVHGMLQNRWSDEIERYERSVVRPWISFSWPKRGHVALGYDLHEFDRSNRREQRAWQRVAIEQPIERFTLLAHVWLEERFFRNTNSVAVRARLNAGTSLDLGRDFSLLLRDELFFDLNGTSRIRNAGLGENHLVLSLSRRLPGGLQFEVGYLQQYLDRRGGDLYNHFLMTGFSWRSPQLADWL